MANTKNATVREISINVIPNFELESRILAQGMHMKVLSPESFKEIIKNQIETAKEADFDASIKIITLLYLYVVAQNITDLEIAGFSVGEYPVVLTSVDEDQELRNLIYTRLQYAPDTSDTDLQQEAMTQFGERYPAMKLMDWKRIIEEYTPMVREAAKQPTATIVEMQQRKYGMVAEGEDDNYLDQ